MLERKSEQEFTERIQKNEGIIHKLIQLYVDNEEDRKDMHQEILCQSWKSYSNFKGDSKFSTWLYKVALNTVLNFQKKRRLQVEEISDYPVAHSNQEDHEVLFVIIKSLNEIDKMLITLHLDGYKNLEISEITGMTQNHINVKLFRIKNSIKEKFKALHDERI